MSYLLLLLLPVPTLPLVLELTPATLPDALQRATPLRPLMLEFYAPWCASCAALEPHYARASSLGGASAEWARIDASAYHSVALRFGVGGYPTVLHVRGGELRGVPLPEAGPGAPEALADFARAGWQRHAPLDGSGGTWRGPLGLAGHAKFLAARPFELAAAALTPLAASFGAPPVVAQFMVALGAVAGAAGGLIAVALCLGPRKRRLVGGRAKKLTTPVVSWKLAALNWAEGHSRTI